MKRYDRDDDDDYQDDNLFPDTDNDYDDDMSSEEYAEMMRRQEALQLMNLELGQLDLNQKLLFKAIKTVKQTTWFFSFRSKQTQLRLIAMMYQFLSSLVAIREEKNA